jgi:hypothetical protein
MCCGPFFTVRLRMDHIPTIRFGHRP